MEVKTIGRKVLEFLKKYRYPVLVLLVGLVLLSLPEGKGEEGTEQSQPQQKTEAPTTAQQLEAILSQIQGVGKVKVMLTQAAGESYLYQYDEDITTSDTDSTVRKDTVIITDGDRNQKPLISQVLPPKYLGAIIVCQGADQAAVKLSVVEAVSRITGLGADMICVMKMK